MAKTTTREWSEIGPDGKPVTMVEIIMADNYAASKPAPTLAEIQAAIAIHELALVTAIRDAHATFGDGRILMLTQTIEALKKLEAGQ